MKIRTHSVCLRRTRNSSTTRFFSLPEEVLLLILKFLPANGLVKLRLVCKSLRNLIDESPTLWMTVSFPGVWPSLRNRAVLERASNVGNIEALIKLGLAHLYNEGISEEGNSTTNAKENGKQAAQLFCTAERAISNAPFTWFFIRPPWAPSGACCKACVFKNMVEYCSKAKPNDVLNKSLLYCIGKILSLHEDEKKKSECIEWLSKAANLGSSHAAYELWNMRALERASEPSHMLQSLRELRDIASSGNTDAQYTLAMKYASGHLGGATKDQAAEFLTQFLQRSRPINSHKLFVFQTELNATMRYILVDWLVEVALMKDFSSQIVHVAVHCVDQYLMRRKVQRTELQLLGITCVLIAARFQGKDIVTIREASWLTDDTYKYEEVVRMMGEVMSCLKGDVRVLTIADFLKLFCNLAAVDHRTECIAAYIGDLSVLHTEFGRYSASCIAASCLLLANSVQGIEIPWPTHMSHMTGLELSDLIESTLYLHQKCLLDDSPIDHRNVKLKAIKERYSEDRFMKVSEIKIPCRDEIRHILLPLANHHDRKTPHIATPICQSLTVNHLQHNDSLDVSIGGISESGYEGDREDEGELVTDDVMDEDDEYLMSEIQSFEEEGMLNKQFGDASFLASDDYSRSSSTPSILRETHDKAFIGEDAMDEPMELEPVAMGDVIEESKNVCAPVARQPLRAIGNSMDTSDVKIPVKRSNQRRKEIPLRTRRTRSNQVTV